MNVLISESWQQFVREEVRSGRFPSEKSVVEEALALLREREKAQPRVGPANGTEARPIGEIIDGLMSDLTAEVLDRLPVDGAAQHDHYIYGTAKRPV
jgi:Arc/MetJ-type ribon-helix-helix transcriptional regulator